MELQKVQKRATRMIKERDKLLLHGETKNAETLL